MSTGLDTVNKLGMPIKPNQQGMVNSDLVNIVTNSNCTTSDIRRLARKLAPEYGVTETELALDLLRYCRLIHGTNPQPTLNAVERFL